MFQWQDLQGVGQQVQGAGHHVQEAGKQIQGAGYHVQGAVQHQNNINTMQWAAGVPQVPNQKQFNRQ